MLLLPGRAVLVPQRVGLCRWRLWVLRCRVGSHPTQ